MKKKIIIFSVVGIIIFFVFLFGVKYVEFSNYVDISSEFNTAPITNVSMDGNFLYPLIEIKGYFLEVVKTPSLNSKEVYNYRITETHVGAKEDKFINFIKFFVAEFVPQMEWKVEIESVDDETIEGHEESGDELSCKPITKFWINKKYGWIKRSIMNPECIYERLYPEKNYSLEEADIYSNILSRTPSWYSKWMSALDEKFSWIQLVRRNMSLNMNGTMISKNTLKNITLLHCSDDEIITKYKVVDVESINGRKCFKVYVLSTHKEYAKCKEFLEDFYKHNNTLMIGEQFNNISGVLWIDYNKRILVNAIFFNEERRKIIKMELE